jgi:hypothetical protein
VELETFASSLLADLSVRDQEAQSSVPTSSGSRRGFNKALWSYLDNPVIREEASDKFGPQSHWA